MELSLRTFCESDPCGDTHCVSVPYHLPDLCDISGCSCDEISGCSTMPIDVCGTCETFSPRIDMMETKDSIMVTAELPGVDDKDINIFVHDGILALGGEKKAGKHMKGADYHQVERLCGSFLRTITLPDTVESGRMERVYENGVLTLNFPKTVNALEGFDQVTTA
jgi:HSP20 family molecular chaperone IbpA